MTDKLLELRIEDLLFAHREVRKNKVGKYVLKYQTDENVDPVSVIYCIHTGKYLVSDGHHRAVAKHFLKRSSILARIEPCYLYCCKGVETDCPSYNICHIILE